MSDKLKDWESKGFVMEDGKLVKKGSAKKSDSKKSSYSKYRNNKVTIDGILFDSEKEGRYYTKLKLQKKAKEILDFKGQVPYVVEVMGKKITTYYLDFEVTLLDGTKEYIDVKAKTKKGKWITTDVFKLKKKLVEAIYGIEIKLK